MTTEPRRVFVLRIAGPAGQEGTHRLRALLKDLRRRQFVCLHAQEEHTPTASDANALTKEGE
jgi:hypothetical protein